jgi:hypothetical protein
MDRDVEDYVRQQNIGLYRRLLTELPADDPRRIVLVKPLSEERTKETVGTKARRWQ